jgi:hypothetical protein
MISMENWSVLGIELQTEYRIAHEMETYWYSFAVPPADSMPFNSASARVLMWPYME